MIKKIKAFYKKQWIKAYRINENNIKDLMSHQPGALYIDLGCDDGKLTKKFARKIGTKNVYGLDINQKILKKSKKRKITPIKADLNLQLPLPSNHFDIITANQVIEHISDIDKFMSEIKRITKKNGYIIISTENGSSWINIFASILGWQIFSLTNVSRKKSGLGNPMALHRHSKNPRKITSWTHKTIFNIRGLIELFEAYDFQILDIRGAGYFPLPCIFSKFDKTHSHFISIKAKKN